MATKKINNLSRIIFVVSLLLTLTGCQKINKANFDKIKVGMTLREVTDILGQPADEFVDLTSTRYLWLSRGNGYLDALEHAKKGKEVKYIIIVFTPEMINSEPRVTGKLFGDIQDFDLTNAK